MFSNLPMLAILRGVRKQKAFDKDSEIACHVVGDNDCAVENASSGQLRIQGLEQLGKVSIQRFRIAALNKDFVPVAEDQRAEPVPLRFEDPCLARR